MKDKMVHTPAIEPDNLTETVLVQLPKADLGFLKTLIDRIGMAYQETVDIRTVFRRYSKWRCLRV